MCFRDRKERPEPIWAAILVFLSWLPQMPHGCGELCSTSDAARLCQETFCFDLGSFGLVSTPGDSTRSISRWPNRLQIFSIKSRRSTSLLHPGTLYICEPPFYPPYVSSKTLTLNRSVCALHPLMLQHKPLSWSYFTFLWFTSGAEQVELATLKDAGAEDSQQLELVTHDC